jgi:hypothetical protein
VVVAAASKEKSTDSAAAIVADTAATTKSFIDYTRCSRLCLRMMSRSAGALERLGWQRCGRVPPKCRENNPVEAAIRFDCIADRPPHGRVGERGGSLFRRD